MDPTVVEQHFTAADVDKDGAISGAEAVAFFGKSGLPTTVLRQVWEMASGGGPKLNKAQFVNALRLTSLAQSLGGQLDLPKARVTLAGMGPALAPPDMTGAWRPGPAPAPAPLGVSPQTTGGSGHSTSGRPAGAVPAAMGAAPAAYGAQGTGGSAGVPASYSPQFTGPGSMPQATGAGGLPPAQPADLQRYEAAFLQLDKDRDGLVQGRDCFGYFMQWSLDKALLKHIWDLVAGNKGTLNKQQLASCLYLMDNAKKGIKPPQKLPPGPFPPVATSWTPQTQFTQAKLGAAPPYQPPPLPTMPQLPAKHVEPASTTPPPEKPSQAPKLDDSTAALLSESERAKISMTQREAAEREAKLHTAEGQAAAARAKLAAYNKALQEITVFKSKTELALLQGQDEASRLESELEECKRKYEQSYSLAQSQGRAATNLRERLAEIIEQRTESEKKLVALQSEIAEASKLTPQDVANMENHVAVLAQQVAAAEHARDAYALRLSGIREQRTALETKLKELADAAAAAAKDEDAARAEVMALADEAQAARSNKGGQGGVAKTAELLSKAAAAYRTLYASVGRAGGEVPFDARPANLGIATWLDDTLAGVADFADNMGAAEASHGYVLVNALPGQVAPKPKPTAPGDKLPGTEGNGTAPADGQQQQQQQQGQGAGAPLPADSFGAASEGFGDDAFVMVGASDVTGSGSGSNGTGAQPTAAGKAPTADGGEGTKQKKKQKGGGGGQEGEGGGLGAAPSPPAAADPFGSDDPFGSGSPLQEEVPSPNDTIAFHLPQPPMDVSRMGHAEPLGRSASGGFGGFGGPGGLASTYAAPDDDEPQGLPPRGAKKKGGGGLDGLFADAPPPPPPTVSPPLPFPAFRPPHTGHGSSSDDEDGSEHGAHDDSSDEGVPFGHAVHHASQPVFRVHEGHDSSEDEAAEPSSPPAVVGAAPMPSDAAPFEPGFGEDAAFAQFSAGPRESGQEGAGALPVSSPISPGGPPAKINPTFDVPRHDSAVHNPTFSETGDLASEGSLDHPRPPASAPAPASGASGAEGPGATRPVEGPPPLPAAAVAHAGGVDGEGKGGSENEALGSGSNTATPGAAQQEAHTASTNDDSLL